MCCHWSILYIDHAFITSIVPDVVALQAWHACKVYKLLELDVQIVLFIFVIQYLFDFHVKYKVNLLFIWVICEKAVTMETVHYIDWQFRNQYKCRITCQDFVVIILTWMEIQCSVGNVRYKIIFLDVVCSIRTRNFLFLCVHSWYLFFKRFNSFCYIDYQHRVICL